MPTAEYRVYRDEFNVGQRASSHHDIIPKSHHDIIARKNTLARYGVGWVEWGGVVAVQLPKCSAVRHEIARDQHLRCNVLHCVVTLVASWRAMLQPVVLRLHRVELCCTGHKERDRLRPQRSVQLLDLEIVEHLDRPARRRTSAAVQATDRGNGMHTVCSARSRV